MKQIILPLLAAVSISVCAAPKVTVIRTGEDGAKCKTERKLRFRSGSDADAIVINPQHKRQEIDGFGGSLTESSAYVLACVSPKQRQAILNELFSSKGANFSMVRTQIGASDFSVEGLYSLCEKEGDTKLTTFSLDRDKEGFPRAKYPYVQDEHYDLYHLMKDVAAIKQGQKDKEYRIVANTWTAPAWMKDNGKYYERDWSKDLHRGGALLPKYYQTYANYLAKFFKTYEAEGIRCWGLTPVNEPMGNDGGWESMDMPGDVEAEFIANYLGPTLEREGLGYLHILGFDQNTFESDPYTRAIYGDPEAKKYTSGMALHWYGSTLSCFPEVLDSLHNLYPDKRLLHTEGCIDNLGCDAWDAVQDKAGFKECCWFKRDAFWWNDEATDWAYSTPYWPEWHPKYAAAQRYAQYIIDGMNHWMTGYIDWNIVLDSIGGPNHVNNFAAAQVMIDYQKGDIYYTPYYYVLKQISRSMRPGDRVVEVTYPAKGVEGIHLCCVEKQDGSYAINYTNMNRHATSFKVRIGDRVLDIKAKPNSVETLLFKL